ncbi:MAG TPA: four-carbon acid sugar kinase family protein [Gaiellaceae bacterium]|nr:four-carbon acid sugar kinase family protein [Gaiellaceae bacterium]
MFLGVIADDVTGATDVASVLAREGMRTVQVVGAPDADVGSPAADAVVVALKSRTAPVAEAVRDSVAALRWLRARGAQRFFFKVCSTFDSTPAGNIGPVADALLDELSAAYTVVTPAYPANGRTVYKGYLFVGDVLLSESSMRDHPLTPMTDSNLVRVLQRQTRRSVGLLGAPEVGYAIADATTDDDLRALGAAYAELPLLVGGAGLALGLPRAYGYAAEPAYAERVDGPAIVLAGSLSEATREQIARFEPRVTLDEYAGYDGTTILVHSGVRDGRPPHEVEQRLAQIAKDAVERGARRVVVAGGETSGAVVRALGISTLAVGDEIAPGVPWMTTLEEPRLSLALKSGNFGGPDFFREALA